MNTIAAITRLTTARVSHVSRGIVLHELDMYGGRLLLSPHDCLADPAPALQHASRCRVPRLFLRRHHYSEWALRLQSNATSTLAFFPRFMASHYFLLECQAQRLRGDHVIVNTR